MSVSKVSLIPVHNSVAVMSQMEQPSMNAAAMKDTFQMKTSVMVKLVLIGSLIATKLL